MDHLELFIILEKAKTVPLESAEIQELYDTPEIQETMNIMGLTTKPIDISETVKGIIKDLNEIWD